MPTNLNQIILVQERLAAANFDLNAFMNIVVDQVQQLTNASGVIVELVEGDEMVYKAAIGAAKDFNGLRLSIGTSISGLCIRTKEVLRSNDTELDPRVNLEACRKINARSLVVAPLFHSGKAVGVLKIMSNQVSSFTETDVQTLQIMAGFIGSALRHQIYHDTTQQLLNERTEALNKLTIAEKTLRHLATHDYLTNLPNRNLLTDKLTSAINTAKSTTCPVALMFLDIDHFKSVNDQWGHNVGDELLQAFALRIKQSIRNYDTVARLGGDEFVILLDTLEKNEDAFTIAKALIDKMKNPFVFNDQKLKISTSIGIAFSNQNNLNPTMLLKQADDALYAAKKAGRNTFKVFADEVNS